MLDGSTLGAGSGCLSTPQLRFEEEGISFAQGSRAIHFIMNGAPQSRNPGGARELSGKNNKKLFRPLGDQREGEREREEKKRQRQTKWLSSFWGTLTPKSESQWETGELASSLI